MTEERLTVLRLVEEKKITVEEAARLLDAMSDQETPKDRDDFGSGEHRSRPFWKGRHRNRHGDWENPMRDFSRNIGEMVAEATKNAGIFGQHGVFGKHGLFGGGWCHTEENATKEETVIPEGSTLEIKCAGGNLRVRGIEGDAIRFPTDEGRWFPFIGPRVSIDEENRRVQVHIAGRSGDVEIPWRVVRLYAGAGGGNLSVEDVSADCDLQVTGGNLSLDRVSGVIDARVIGGNATCEAIQSTDVRVKATGGNASLRSGNLTEGRIELSAVGGNVKLRLSPDSSFRLEAQAKKGRIRANIPGAHQGGGRDDVFQAIYGDGAAAVTLETRSGNIDIDIAASEPDQEATSNTE